MKCRLAIYEFYTVSSYSIFSATAWTMMSSWTGINPTSKPQQRERRGLHENNESLHIWMHLPHIIHSCIIKKRQKKLDYAYLQILQNIKDFESARCRGFETKFSKEYHLVRAYDVNIKRYQQGFWQPWNMAGAWIKMSGGGWSVTATLHKHKTVESKVIVTLPRSLRSRYSAASINICTSPIAAIFNNNTAK